MQRRHSIFFKLNLFFLLALLTLALLFAFFRITANHMEMRREGLRGMELGRLLHHTRHLDSAQRAAELKEAQFALLSQDALPPDAQKLLLPPRPHRREEPRPFFTLYVKDGTYYFRSLRTEGKWLIRDERPAETFTGMQFIFFLLLAGLITLYVLLRRSLLPLRTLHAQIRRFALGELDIDTASVRRDEIAAVANEFNDALGELRHLRASRQLFLRNVMHELKTPLTKGKLALAMMDENEQTAYLDRLFGRMDELINRIAEIEKLQSSRLDRTPCALADLLEEAMGQLYLAPEHSNLFRTALAEGVTLDVDRTLFVSALANLLDNAVKYADALPVDVTADAEALCIANRGPALEENISNYLQPFSSGHASGGLGLGLTIADTIIRAHGFTLRYTYAQGKHLFCIRYANPKA